MQMLNLSPWEEALAAIDLPGLPGLGLQFGYCVCHES